MTKKFCLILTVVLFFTSSLTVYAGESMNQTEIGITTTQVDDNIITKYTDENGTVIGVGVYFKNMPSTINGLAGAIGTKSLPEQPGSRDFTYDIYGRLDGSTIALAKFKVSLQYWYNQNAPSSAFTYIYVTCTQSGATTIGNVSRSGNTAYVEFLNSWTRSGERHSYTVNSIGSITDTLTNFKY